MRGPTTQEPVEAATLEVRGMHCASCVSNVERAIREVPGVREAAVNLATEQAAITFDPGTTSAEALAAAITEAGYEARTRPVTPDAVQTAAHIRRAEAESARWRARALLGVTMALPVTVAGMFWTGRESGILQAILTTGLQVLLGRVFIRGAWRASRHARADMDTLIALGTTTAYIYSVWTLWVGRPHFFFDTAATILALIAVGKWLEARARESATGAVARLLDLASPAAVVERNGVELEVPAAQLIRGDLAVARPGSRIPADGVIESGETTIDESLVTGEPMPVSRVTGDAVVGGSINLSGAIRIRVARAGAESTIGQMAALVEAALATKTGSQRLADAIAGVFVPVVCVIAIGSLVAWGLAGSWIEGLHAAIAVLIVACPCALGLATPAAVMVGCAVGSRRGILIRSAQVLERMGRLDTVVLDKTGTLTIGKPLLQQVVSVEAGCTQAHALSLAAGVERFSEHPLARAVLAAASARGIQLAEATGFVNEPGGGVRASVRGANIRIGKLGAADPIPEIADLREKGFTLSGVFQVDAHESRLLAVLAFSDDLRPGARDVVVELQGLGLETIMLTGDHETAARRIAAQAGIEVVLAGVSPQDKHANIRSLRRQGRKVAMVGDGINDAAALAEADVGIAMGAGADIAKEAGDVVLVSGDPTGIPRAIRLSLAMRRRIRLGLLWAFVYNTVLIPLAAIGLLHPMLAAAAMAVSSASVVANALLLLRFDRRPD